MINLEGKKILITGASSGIGQATAILCDSLGASVYITGRDDQKLALTRSQMTDRTIIILADLTRDEQLENLVNSIDNLDGIYHGIGMIQPYPIKFIKLKNIDHIFQTNFNSSVLLTSHLLAKKKINKGASFVFTSSVSAAHPYIGGSLYASTKAAIEAFSRSLALECAGQKIRSNVVSPALVQTEIFEQTRDAYNEDEFSKLISQYPLGIGKPIDVANTIAFLLSDSSSWITGSAIKLDGGLLLNSKR